VGERQEFNSSGTVVVSKCSNQVKLFLTFDRDGGVITSEGKNGNLYAIPSGNCIFGSTVHFKAKGSEVKCKMDCLAKVK
jgi:hypothetical protein